MQLSVNSDNYDFPLFITSLMVRSGVDYTEYHTLKDFRLLGLQVQRVATSWLHALAWFGNTWQNHVTITLARVHGWGWISDFCFDFQANFWFLNADFWFLDADFSWFQLISPLSYEISTVASPSIPSVYVTKLWKVTSMKKEIAAAIDIGRKLGGRSMDAGWVSSTGRIW